jgi:hypothetical protein
MMAESVPFGTVFEKYIGTVSARLSIYRFIVRWLPFCRQDRKPACSRVRINSFAVIAGRCLDTGARHLHESAENKRYFFIRDRLTMGLKVLQVELNRFFGILCRLFYGGAIRYTARKKGHRYRVAPFLFRNQVDLVRQYFLHKVILYTNWVPVKLAGSAISVSVEVRAQLTLGDVSERLFINCYRCVFVQVTMSRNGEHLLGTVRQNSSQHNVAPTLRYRLESEGNKHADAEFSFQLFQPS